MTFQQELASWWGSPIAPPTAEPPQNGAKRPDTPQLELKDGRPAAIAFLRHCGCPFAEKTFLNLRDVAKDRTDVDFIAVSHSDKQSTDTWLKSLPQAGSEPTNLRVVVDDKLEVYAAWGLGPSGWAHVLSPWSMYTAYKLGKQEAIPVRPTSSGSRWQTSGTYVVDRHGSVTWGGPAQRADEIPDLDKALESLEANRRTESKL